MKRSKTFLGITTAILTVAGVTAAKHYGPYKPRLYITADGHACLPTLALTCTQGGVLQCIASTSGGTLFNVYTDGPPGVKTINNCKHELKYHNEG